MTLLEELQRALQEESERVPDGWQTIAEIAAFERVSISTATRMVKGLRKLGKMEMRKFRVDTGDKVYPVPHYRLSRTACEKKSK